MTYASRKNSPGHGTGIESFLEQGTLAKIPGVLRGAKALLAKTNMNQGNTTIVRFLPKEVVGIEGRIRRTGLDCCQGEGAGVY